MELSCQRFDCLDTVKNIWQVTAKFVPDCSALNGSWQVIIHLMMSFQPHYLFYLVLAPLSGKGSE